jgi:AraC-like DNA-binding protein
LRLLTSILFLLFAFYSNSQQEKTTFSQLIPLAQEFLYNEPNQTISVSKQIIKNSKQKSEIANANLLLSQSYFLNGNYRESIYAFFDSYEIAIDINDKDFNFILLSHAALLFEFLGLPEIQPIIEINLNIEPNKYSLIESKKIFYQTKYQKDYNDFSELLNNDPFIENLSIEPEMIIFTTDVALSHYKLAIEQQDLKEAIIHRLNLNVLFKNMRNGLQTMQFYILEAKFDIMNKDYLLALENLENAKFYSSKFSNAYYNLQIYDLLSHIYLVMGVNLRFQEHHIKFNENLILQANSEQEAANAIFNILNNRHIYQKAQIEGKLKNIRFYLVFTIIVLGIIWVIVKLFFTINLKHKRDIINYLKLIQDTDKKEEVINNKPEAKPLEIPKEKEDLILQKLEKFEAGNKFISKDMSLAQLASFFETNTKYLSEVINKHKGKNFNLYINSLRIKYIVKKLKTDPTYLNYKVSYLAQESGFSSHSSFATVFKNITGISPNVFVELLKKDKNNNLIISA